MKRKTLFTALVAFLLCSCNNDDDALNECDQVINQVERVIADEIVTRVSIRTDVTVISNATFQIERPFIVVEGSRYNLCQMVSFSTVNDGRMTLNF